MGFFKHILFGEASSLVKLAKNKDLTEADILPLPSHLHPENSSLFERNIQWTTPRQFLISLLRAIKAYLILAYSWNVLSSIFALISPVLIHQFIGLISSGVVVNNINEILIYGVLLGLCGFLSGLFSQYYFFNSLQAFQISVNILNKRIYQHSLKLSNEARQENQIGEVVNHMSSDTDSASDFLQVLGDLAVAALLIVGVTVMLFYYLGWSALAALSVLLMLAPLTRYVAGKFTVLETEMCAHRDHRVTMITQALNAIRIVKYFAWERSIAKEINDIRQKEILSRRQLAKAEVLAAMAYLGVSSIVLFVALAVHAWRGEKLDAALIFTCISLFGLLEGPFGNLSNLISRFTNSIVSADRILKFLRQKEVQSTQQGATVSLHSVGVKLNDVGLTYAKSEQPTLKNIDLKINPGKSLAVVGPVGAGKSSLLYALLGEVPASGVIQFFPLGENEIPRTAYVPQEAYIVNSTLKENLQLGENVTEAQLSEALYASCLQQDLSEWASGLQTEIGEKGVNLSGGQKQRVSLARAFLRKPQLVLLDDPLSAVDAETEKDICERLIFGAWKQITRIVVTHRLEHLSSFDQVLYLENGAAKGLGHFDDLLKTCEPFAEFYKEHNKTQGDGELTALTVNHGSSDKHATKQDTDNKNSRLTKDEEREVGAVKSSVYWSYISSLGGDGRYTKGLILIALALGAIGVTVLPLLQKAWLSYYSNHQQEWKALEAVGIFGLVSLAVLVGFLINNVFWLERGIRAGQSMHNKMLNSVLSAPVRFFDATPIGRIIQRFSRDIESVDVYLQWSFDYAIHCALQVIVSLVLILSLMPKMIFVIGPIMVLYYVLQNDYRKPAREIKRMDSIARSPRYAHFKETLQGLMVIRNFDKASWFMDNFNQKLAHSQKAFYSHYLVNRWFSSRIPLVGGLISSFTAVGITLSCYYGLMDAGTAGLITLYSLSFWGYLNSGIRIFADMEARMTSVERLKFYANLPAEKSVLYPSDQPLRESWPEKGQIAVENLKLRYAEHFPLVLKGLTFNVNAGQRVGIIGRTGSGKSTLLQTLYRFTEAEEGRILIDGVDIATVPLEKLRRNIAIVPQDPVLFMGTIRNNLDRFNEYSDDEVTNALKLVSLWNYISELPQGLNAIVTEGGLNLSQGQRQLLCLARALLMKAKIIVMDEATASVDVQSDALLQKVIRSSFAGVTMLIIAHRLGTIADCDQIVEIAAGEIKSIRLPSEISADEIEKSLV